MARKTDVRRGPAHPLADLWTHAVYHGNLPLLIVSSHIPLNWIVPPLSQLGAGKSVVRFREIYQLPPQKKYQGTNRTDDGKNPPLQWLSHCNYWDIHYINILYQVIRCLISEQSALCQNWRNHGSSSIHLSHYFRIFMGCRGFVTKFIRTEPDFGTLILLRTRLCFPYLSWMKEIIPSSLDTKKRVFHKFPAPWINFNGSLQRWSPITPSNKLGKLEVFRTSKYFGHIKDSWGGFPSFLPQILFSFPNPTGGEWKVAMKFCPGILAVQLLPKLPGFFW